MYIPFVTLLLLQCYVVVFAEFVSIQFFLAKYRMGYTYVYPILVRSNHVGEFIRCSVCVKENAHKIIANVPVK